MLIALYLYIQGSEGLKKPPMKEKKTPYDSCVDNEENPSLYCIFNEEQYCPLYLIRYKWTTSSSSSRDLCDIGDEGMVDKTYIVIFCWFIVRKNH